MKIVMMCTVTVPVSKRQIDYYTEIQHLRTIANEPKQNFENLIHLNLVLILVRGYYHNQVFAYHSRSSSKCMHA
jgi:hypothetical protein